MRTLILSSLLALGLAAAVSAQQAASPIVSDPTAQDAAISFGGPEPVRFVTATGDEHVIMAEIAATPEQQQRGLMWRDSIEPGTGMLFQYVPAEPASMWMRNTLVDLDILYVNEAGRIVKIIAYAQAESRRSLSAEATVSGVIELGAGQSIAMGLRPGDRVYHPFFPEEAAAELTEPDMDAAQEAPVEAQ
jgi:uncharacterized protein